MKTILKEMIGRAARSCATAFALAAAVLMSASVRAADPVAYLDWNGTEMTNATCTAYTVVTADTATFEDGGWYVVTGDVWRNGEIIVNGSAHLILADGAKLSVNGSDDHAGLEVADGCAITIYGQTLGTGVLKATGAYGFEGEDLGCGAGIGGGALGACGTVTINGGTITAEGRYYHGEDRAGLGGSAGIGGGNNGAGGTITINGGTVKATGGGDNGAGGAGIGSGSDGAGGTITINGGTVTATGGCEGVSCYFGGAGIGSGSNGAGGTITINGGTVTATGGSQGGGIGGGINGAGGTVTINDGVVTATAGDSAAGIGGGRNGAGGAITINGGVITATGGNYSRSMSEFIGGGTGIGCGGAGAGGTVTIGGGTVTATGNYGAAGIGGAGVTITVNGGTVMSTGGINAAGIGGGFNEDGGTVAVNGGTVTATGGASGCAGIGSGVGDNPDPGTLAIGAGLYLWAGVDTPPEVLINPDGTAAGLAAKLVGQRYLVVNDVPPVARNGEKMYASIAASIAALEGTGGTLGNITVLDPAAACPDGYYLEGTSVIQYLTVSYLDEDGDERSTNVCKAVAADTATFEDGGWYVVTGDVTCAATIVVNGGAHLILADGAKLSVNGSVDRAGIGVADGCAITIYGQTLGTGELLAQGGDDGAGIGGGNGCGGGAVAVYGGRVAATGGAGAAGIGGGTGNSNLGSLKVGEWVVVRAGSVNPPTTELDHDGSGMIALGGERYYLASGTPQVARIGEVGYTSVKAALESGAGSRDNPVVLIRNAALTTAVTLGGDLFLRAEGDAVLTMKGDASFLIPGGAHLTVSNLVIEGVEPVEEPAFLVTGGTLTLESGAVLSGLRGTADSTQGGAVVVTSGNFIMKTGSVIRDCESSGNGGGVCLAGASSKAELLGGTIEKCHALAASGGGAVYSGEGASVDVGGDFTATNNTAGAETSEATCNLRLSEDTVFTLKTAATGRAGVSFEIQEGRPDRNEYLGSFIAVDPSLSPAEAGTSGRAIVHDVDIGLRGRVNQSGDALFWDGQCDQQDANVIVTLASGEVRYYADLPSAFRRVVHTNATFSVIADETITSDVVVDTKARLESADSSSDHAMIWRSNEAMIRVLPGAELEIDGINLSGAYGIDPVWGFSYDSWNGLIYVDGGTLRLLDMTIVGVCGSSPRHSNAITVAGGGTLIMTGDPGPKLSDCNNYYIDEVIDIGHGGAILLNASTAYLEAGEIYNSLAWRAGALFAENGSTVYVSGSFTAVDNINYDDYDYENFIIEKGSQLVLRGELTGEIGVTDRPAYFSPILGPVEYAGDLPALQSSAAKIYRDSNASIKALVATNSTGALLVWPEAVFMDEAGNSCCEDWEGNLYGVITTSAGQPVARIATEAGTRYYQTIQLALDALVAPLTIDDVEILDPSAAAPNGYYVEGTALKACLEVFYRDADGMRKTAGRCKPVRADTATFASGGWYVVSGEVVRVTSGIVVNGSANLILCDGAKLVVAGTENEPGIRIASGSSLTIYGQDSDTGLLEVTGGSGAAGIGGTMDAEGGKITIYGGKVTAQAGTGGMGVHGTLKVGGKAIVKAGPNAVEAVEQANQDDLIDKGAYYDVHFPLPLYRGTGSSSNPWILVAGTVEDFDRPAVARVLNDNSSVVKYFPNFSYAVSAAAADEHVELLADCCCMVRTSHQIASLDFCGHTLFGRFELLEKAHVGAILNTVDGVQVATKGGGGVVGSYDTIPNGVMRGVEIERQLHHPGLQLLFGAVDEIAGGYFIGSDPASLDLGSRLEGEVDFHDPQPRTMRITGGYFDGAANDQPALAIGDYPNFKVIVEGGYFRAGTTVDGLWKSGGSMNTVIQLRGGLFDRDPYEGTGGELVEIRRDRQLVANTDPATLDAGFLYTVEPVDYFGSGTAEDPWVPVAGTEEQILGLGAVAKIVLPEAPDPDWPYVKNYYSSIEAMLTAAKNMDAKALAETETNRFDIAGSLAGALTAAMPGGRVFLLSACTADGELDLRGCQVLTAFDAGVAYGNLAIDDSVGGAFFEPELQGDDGSELVIRGGSFLFDPTEFLPDEDRYFAIESEDETYGTVWTVFDNPAYPALKEAYGDVADIGFQKGEDGEPDVITLTLTNDVAQIDLAVDGDETEVVIDLNGHRIAADPGSGEGYAIRIAKGTKARIIDSQGGGLVTGEKTVGEPDFDEVTYPASIVVRGELVVEGGVYDGAIDVAKKAKLAVTGGKFKDAYLKELNLHRPLIGDEFAGGVTLPDGKTWKKGKDGYWTLAAAKAPTLDLPDFYGPFPKGRKISFTDRNLKGCKISGLPKGVKFTASKGRLSGTPKAEGVAKLTVTRDGKKKTVRLVIGATSLRYVKVVKIGAGKGKATPAVSVVKKGKTVKLVAKAKGNSVFAGWYRRGKCLSLDTTYAYKATKDPEQEIAAFFTLKKYDSDPKLRIGDAKSGTDVSERVALGKVLTVYRGVPLKYDLRANSFSKAKISVKNLPAGLKYNAKKGVVSGTPTKAQCVNATITVKNAAVSRKFAFAFTVLPLPDWAKGSYTGACYVRPVAPDGDPVELGKVDFTVSPGAKLSGKILADDTTYAFTVKNFMKYDADRKEFVASVTPKDAEGASLGKIRLVISEGANGYGQFYGTFAKAGDGSRRYVSGAQVPWSRTDAVKYDLPVLPEAGLSLKLANGLSAKFGEEGVVTLSGKLPGKGGKKVKVSATAQVVLSPGEPANAAFLVYVPKSTGLAADYCEVIRLVVEVDFDGVVESIREFDSP